MAAGMTYLLLPSTKAADPRATHQQADLAQPQQMISTGNLKTDVETLLMRLDRIPYTDGGLSRTRFRAAINEAERALDLPSDGVPDERLRDALNGLFQAASPVIADGETARAGSAGPPIFMTAPFIKLMTEICTILGAIWTIATGIFAFSDAETKVRHKWAEWRLLIGFRRP